MVEENFEDRVSENPNRRKITILKQQGNEIVADIEFADSVVDGKVGTPLNAEMINGFAHEINTASSNASHAKEVIDNLSVSLTAVESNQSPSVAISTNDAGNRKIINFNIPNPKKGTSYRSRGEWNASVQYVNDEYYIDTVTYNGATYFAKRSNLGVAPIDNDSSADWEVLAKKGSNASVTIVNNLTSTDSSCALAASQGKVLDGKITTLNSTVSSVNDGLTSLNGTVNSLNLNSVKLSGDQTISGTKTFSSSPKVPTPSSDDNSTAVATTAWVKDYICPAGTVVAFAGSTIPAGWLLCDGSMVNKSDYPDLFNAIETTYGTGNGSTTFNLPNLSGKVLIGTNSNYSLGSSGGEETHYHDFYTGLSWYVGAAAGDRNSLGYDAQNKTWSGATEEVTVNSWTNNALASGSQLKNNNRMKYKGTTESSSNMPPYLTLNYIIKY